MPTAIYPGSFDPITLGHINIIERASRLFDRVIVSILHNSNKQALFTTEERLVLAKESLAHLANINIVSFEGLLVDFAYSQQINVILRGLRNMADVDFEFQLSGMNRQLHSDIETLFLSADGKYAHISSSLIKEIAKQGRDTSAFVPKNVVKALERIYAPRR
jgi:pantetheine-phosphate adenylyltransferase